MESLNKLDNEFIHKINQLIEERLSSDKIDINYLFYFRQCFKEEFGCIPSEYLKKLKENAAK